MSNVAVMNLGAYLIYVSIQLLINWKHEGCPNSLKWHSVPSIIFAFGTSMTITGLLNIIKSTFS